ncbi:MAG: hypothetical protein ACWA40_05895 [Planktomarina sp.]
MIEIVNSQLLEGVWTAHLKNVRPGAKVTVQLNGTPIENVSYAQEDDGTYVIIVPVPIEALTDGTHSFLLDAGNGQVQKAFSVIAGDAVNDDLRAEVGLLRAELDMLKMAFRKHIVSK